MSDLLSVVNADLQLSQDKRINSSYSADALEFKRLSNHFPLGGLTEAMDRALQRMSPSEQTYSLFPKERYEAYRAQVNRDVEAFIEQMGFTEAQPLVEYLKTGRRRLSRLSISLLLH